MTEISAADILAAGDVLDQVVEQSDQVGFDRSVELLDALESLKRKVGSAISLLTTQQLKLLEDGAKTAPDGRVYVSVPNYMERFDHDAIGLAVVDHAVREATDTDTGVVSSRRAAEAAVAAMRSLYTSAQSKAKVTPMDSLGIARKRVTTREHRGRKVQITDPRPKEDDE